SLMDFLQLRSQLFARTARWVRKHKKGAPALQVLQRKVAARDTGQIKGWGLGSRLQTIAIDAACLKATVGFALTLVSFFLVDVSQQCFRAEGEPAGDLALLIDQIAARRRLAMIE